MCHETQIPEPGDYFISYIGEDQVIVVRGEDRQVRVLLNSCRHRGNALCRAELGNTKTFVCSYHGWTYGLDGKLIGIPGKTVSTRQDIMPALKEMLNNKGSYLLEIMVGKENNVFPMVPQGRGVAEIVLSKEEV